MTNRFEGGSRRRENHYEKSSPSHLLLSRYGKNYVISHLLLSLFFFPHALDISPCSIYGHNIINQREREEVKERKSTAAFPLLSQSHNRIQPGRSIHFKYSKFGRRCHLIEPHTQTDIIPGTVLHISTQIYVERNSIN